MVVISKVQDSETGITFNLSASLPHNVISEQAKTFSRLSITRNKRGFISFLEIRNLKVRFVNSSSYNAA